jgi:hypothetical protein
MQKVYYPNGSGERNMKLRLLFIVMDLLTVLAYPVVFVYDKLRQFIKLDLLQKYLTFTKGPALDRGR